MIRFIRASLTPPIERWTRPLVLQPLQQPGGGGAADAEGALQIAFDRFPGPGCGRDNRSKRPRSPSACSGDGRQAPQSRLRRRLDSALISYPTYRSCCMETPPPTEQDYILVSKLANVKKQSAKISTGLPLKFGRHRKKEAPHTEGQGASEKNGLEAAVQRPPRGRSGRKQRQPA